MAVESATLQAPSEELDRVAGAYHEAEERFRTTGDRSLMIERDYMVHDLLMRYRTNDKLIQLMGELRDLIDWAQTTMVSREPRAYDVTVHEHLHILDAMRERDVETARIAIREHLEGALARYTGSRVV